MSVRLERLIRIYNRLRRGPVTIEVISRWAGAAVSFPENSTFWE